MEAIPHEEHHEYHEHEAVAPTGPGPRQAFYILRFGFTVAPIIAGIDKFTHLLVNWDKYLAPWIANIVKNGHMFMQIVGVVEIIAGLIVLTGMTRFGGYLVMAWLIGIAINLVTTGMYYDLAVRDVEIALGAFTLAKLSEVREDLRDRVPDVRPQAA